jgi:hypothetical protein
MSDIDDEPRGRSSAAAVIIAVIFLAILGTGVGIVLGSANKKDGGDDVGSGVTASATPTGSVTQTTGPGGSDNDPNGTGTKTRNPTGTSYPGVTKSECPKQTQDRAGTSLSVTIYIKTARAEVWICGGGGRTVYQGHILDTPFTAATTDTTLYIGSVNYEAGVWAATNGATTYYVSRDRLRQEENGVVTVNDPVVDRYEG